MFGWDVAVAQRDETFIQVLPVNDLKSHNEAGEFCHCEPRLERYPNKIIVIHNAYDGREFTEIDRQTTGH
jgi:hypothetical protein